MGILIVILLFLVLTAVVFAFGYMHYVKPSRLLDQLTNSTSDAIPVVLTRAEPKRESSFTKWLEPIGNLLPVSPQDALGTKHRMLTAGIRSSSAVPVYYGLKIVLAGLLVIIAVLFRDSATDNPLLRVIAPVAGGALGFCLPG